jgi:hypothetical protein
MRHQISSKPAGCSKLIMVTRCNSNLGQLHVVLCSVYASASVCTSCTGEIAVAVTQPGKETEAKRSSGKVPSSVYEPL